MKQTNNQISDNPYILSAELNTAGVSGIQTFRMLDNDGVLIADPQENHLAQDTALKILNTMQFIRVLDERMVAAQRQGRLSFYLACTGEEAAVVASAAALDDDDMIMSQYREQGALAYRGFTIDAFMNQLFSNELEHNKGRQMPIHYGSKDHHFMTISSPLGTQIPQAAGYAYGQKLNKLSSVTLCYFGEGAASEGDFHAGLNMAAVHGSPVIFFCRNNGYAISTPSREQFAGDGIASRGIGYGIATIRVDGNDAVAVFHAVRKARIFALEQNRPVLIEAMTYRLAAHSTSDDPSSYRSLEEEAIWRERDPIRRFKQWLIHQQWYDDSDEAEGLSQLKAEVLNAMKTAEKIPVCAIDDLVTDVYAEVTPQLKQQLDELKEHIAQYPDVYPKTSGRL